MSENPPRFVRDVPEDEHDLDHGEEARPSGGRRRRPVADWGVGDDMFEHMPRRRFPHSTEGPARDRRAPARDEAGREQRPDAADAADAPGADASDSPRADASDSPRADAADTPRADAADIPRGPAPDGRRTIRIGSEDDVPSEIAALTADRDLGGDDPPAGSRPASVRPRVEPGTRRTVKIGGRPEGSGFYQGPQRRRPRRAAERIGPRPDRLAAYAVALGVLLILIAILTAQ